MNPLWFLIPFWCRLILVTCVQVLILVLCYVNWGGASRRRCYCGTEGRTHLSLSVVGLNPLTVKRAHDVISISINAKKLLAQNTSVWISRASGLRFKANGFSLQRYLGFKGMLLRVFKLNLLHLYRDSISTGNNFSGFSSTLGKPWTSNKGMGWYRYRYWYWLSKRYLSILLLTIHLQTIKTLHELEKESAVILLLFLSVPYI